jgi:hypothetical protein
VAGRGRATLVALLAAAALAAPAPAAAQLDGFSDWNRELPGFPSNASPSARALCAGGSSACIDRTIGEMYRRFHRAIPTCEDNNVFSLTYIRVTEDIRAGIHAGFYPDLRWINRLDAIFAVPYFLALDNWRAGRTELVSPSWQIAFDTARDRQVKGLGNLLLAMNAHINRDFPFALALAGVAGKKAEHDSGNQRLRKLYSPMLRELARRFDPSIDDFDVPGTELDDEAFFQTLVGWRERAWQNAVRLAAARGDAERRRVAAAIEAEALTQANLIRGTFSYRPGESTAAREALCAAAGGQRAGYPRGAEVLRPMRTSRRGPARLRVVVRCPDGVGPCRSLLRVRGAGVRRRVALPAGTRRAVRVKLPRRAQRRLARAARPRVLVRSLLGPGESRRRSLPLR